MKALVFDTETTGLVINGMIRDEMFPEVIEYCGVVVDLAKGTIGVPFATLVKPSRTIPEENTNITGIDMEMVANAPLFATVASQIQKQIESSICVIAHNLSFDKEMIDKEMSRAGLSIKWPRGLCTVEQTVYLKGFRLSESALYEHLFNEKMKVAHRAEVDVMALSRIAIELFKRGML